MVVGGVAVAANGAHVSSMASSAVCTILDLAGGNCGATTPGAAPPKNEDFKPAACKVREDSEKAGSKVTIAWFSIGKEYGFIEQKFSDGSVRLTMVDTASLGATGSGKEKLFDIGKLGDNGKAGAKVEVAAGLKFGYGDTWSFPNEGEMNKFRDEIEKYQMQQIQMENAGEGAFGIALWNSITDNWADPPDPTITFAKTSVEASLKGALGLKIPTGPAAKPGDNPPTADPNLGGSLTLKGEYEVLLEHNEKAGTTSWTYQLTGTGTLAGNAGLVGGELGGKTAGAFKVTRNDKGELVSLSFISTREGSAQGNKNGKSPVAIKGSKASGKDGTTYGQAEVTTTTLDLTNAEDRAVAQAWLSGNNEQFGSPFDLTYSTLVPDKPPAAGDTFGQLMYEKAKVAQVHYDNITDIEQFGLEVNLGWKFGFDVSLENSTSQASGAEYLGAPADGGVRPMVDYTECR
jgi:hypothetical protein